MLPPLPLKRGNWVDGAVRGASGGDTFAVASPAGEPERERRWPRSTADDVVEALRAADRAAADWRRLAVRERARVLRAVLRQVETDLADAPGLAAHLGLDVDGLAAVHGRWRPRLEARASEGRAGSGRVAVVATDWSELVPGALRALVDHAAAGRAVLYLPDRRFPHAGDVVARAWERRSPVPAALAVLHGVDAATGRAALERAEVTHATISGTSQRLARWSAPGSAPESEVELALRPLRSRSACVRGGDDVRARASELVSAAFGRRTLAGQRSGQVARVFCHTRVFSAFTEAFLAEAERGLEEHGTLPFVDRDAWLDLQAACKLGLDEGATQILGGEDAVLSPRGERPPVHPAIFTNVEPGMRLLERGHPAPLVALVRAASDGAALELERAAEERARAGA